MRYTGTELAQQAPKVNFLLIKPLRGGVHLCPASRTGIWTFG